MVEMYSIWLVPEEKAVYQKFVETVETLSNRFGGPIFEPHLTLLADEKSGKAEMLSKVEKLAGQLKPLTLETGELSFSTTYFQSVLVFIKANAELMKARVKATELFGRENSAYMPHISVMYGEFSMDKKEEAMKSLSFPRTKFTVNSLIVTPAAGDPKDWYRVAEFDLG